MAVYNGDVWRGALAQLDQAIANHERWHKDLIRTITCRLPGDPRDMAEDAHRQCRFGQWYHGTVDQVLQDHPAFNVLGTLHQRMHGLASNLVRQAARGEAASPLEFDAFSEALEQLRLELQTLKREVDDSLRSRDPLTGAENRVGMLTRLREAHALVKRDAGRCCIAMMDLDHFKAINDTHGHPTGDQVLAGVCAYVMEHLRPYDRVFRYGGEEFLISMPSIDPPVAQAVIERIRSGLAQAVLAESAGMPVVVTASFGLAAMDRAASVEEAISRADRAMYAAKSGGRNRLCVWDPAMSMDAKT